MAATLAGGMAHMATAQPYPAKAARIIITYPTCGSSDFTMRPITPCRTEKWGQPVVVESRPAWCWC